MESILLGMVLCGGLSPSLGRNLNLFLGVDVAESVETSALGGGGGKLRDLNLNTPGVDAVVDGPLDYLPQEVSLL